MSSDSIRIQDLKFGLGGGGATLPDAVEDYYNFSVGPVFGISEKSLDEKSLFQVPLAFKIGTWGPIVIAGGETGLRWNILQRSSGYYKSGIISLEGTTFFGESGSTDEEKPSSGSVVIPSLRLGFLNCGFNLESGIVAYSKNNQLNAGQFSLGISIDVLSLITGYYLGMPG